MANPSARAFAVQLALERANRWVRNLRGRLPMDDSTQDRLLAAGAKRIEASEHRLDRSRATLSRVGRALASDAERAADDTSDPIERGFADLDAWHARPGAPPRPEPPDASPPGEQ